MSQEYSISYKAQNEYENWVHDAHWQFLIIPEHNDNQQFVHAEFSNSANATIEYSVNGYGFQTIRVRSKEMLKTISFEANFKLIKKKVDPFAFDPNRIDPLEYGQIETLHFKADFEPYLRLTRFTTLPVNYNDIFVFDKQISIFDNLIALNNWTFIQIYFKTGVTDVDTTLGEIIEKRHGVCQDFAHLFCAIAKRNGIPARYVSGYLHQGNGYFGDSQMHAWAEVFLPNLGWIGFDPTNNILASTDHIKVSHGKDYNDCSPLKGIVFTTGNNKTTHSVSVTDRQQQ